MLFHLSQDLYQVSKELDLWEVQALLFIQPAINLVLGQSAEAFYACERYCSRFSLIIVICFVCVHIRMVDSISVSELYSQFRDCLSLPILRII